MAVVVLPLQIQSSLLINKHRRFLHLTALFASPAKSIPIPRPRPATSQDTSNSAINDDPPTSEEEEAESKKPISSGQGFGRPAPPPKPIPQKAGRRVVRRAPVERPPSFVDKKDGEGVGKEPPLNESAFLLTWLGLGVVILTQGILLASSGFLPEQWDNFLVKYLYPSFTPTVALFVAGTVSYGVFKYLQNENAKTSSK